MSNLVIPIIFSLEQLALHEISKKLWNNFVLQDSIFIAKSHVGLDEPYFFIDYRNKILKALPELFPSGFPKLWKRKLIDSVFTLELGYGEAVEWEYHYRHILPFSAISSNVGSYEASHFINPLGYFDDLSWVKAFLADENQPLQFRFYIACCYCFEKEINDLWRRMKANNLLPCEGNLERIDDEMDALISLWVYHLENKIEDVDFYTVGFNEAFYVQNVYAINFFWTVQSADDRADVLLENATDDLANSAQASCVGFVHFVYSLLTIEMKKSLIAQTVTGNWGSKIKAEIWSCMLCSYFHKSVLNDILTFPHLLPVKFYENILHSILFTLREYPITVHKEVFKTLWNHLSHEEQNEVLKSRDLLLGILVDINDIDLLGTVILPLAQSMKESILFYDWCCAGISKLFDYFKLNDYDGYLCYLFFFFLDWNPVNKKFRVRVDAISLLDRFIDKFYPVFNTNIELQELKIIIEHFRATLPLLDQLFTQQEEKTTELTANWHNFLSLKIYPLLSVKGKITSPANGEEKKVTLCNSCEVPCDCNLRLLRYF